MSVIRRSNQPAVHPHVSRFIHGSMHSVRHHIRSSPQGLALGSTSFLLARSALYTKLMDAKAKPWRDGRGDGRDLSTNRKAVDGINRLPARNPSKENPANSGGGSSAGKRDRSPAARTCWVGTG